MTGQAGRLRRFVWASGAALAGLAFGASHAIAAATQTEVWRGAYDCAQGLTGMTLTLLVQSDGNAFGLFEFYPVSANPAVPTGCFEMSGTMGQDGRLTLHPGAWRRQPSGYVTVGLTGQEIDPSRLTGSIQGPGCSNFALTRQTMPAQPSACGSVSA